jgi:ankyrin repeat protein
MKVFSMIAQALYKAAWASGIRSIAGTRVYNPSLDDAMITAMMDGSEEQIRELLEAGGNPNAQRRPESPAVLAIAAARGRDDVIGMLLDAGAHIDATDAFHTTALMSAAEMGRTESVQLLLSRGARVDAMDSDNRTALALTVTSMLSSRSDRCLEVVRSLLSFGANVHLPDKLGRTPLIHAAARGFHDVMVELLKHGARPTHPSQIGRTALHEAMTAGYPIAMCVLFNHGESPFGTMPDGRSYDEFCADKPECFAALQARRNALAIERVMNTALSNASPQRSGADRPASLRT